MPAIKPADFAKQCLMMWREHGGNAYYVAAVAMLRSTMSDDTVNGKVGPYGWTQDQWNANPDLKNSTFGADTYGPEDISDWTAQVSVYTLNTVNALQGLNQPSALQLYQKQWPADAGDPQLATKLQNACDATKQAILDAIDQQLPADTTATASVIADSTKPLATGTWTGGAGAGGSATAGSPADGSPATDSPSGILRGDGSFKFTAEVVGNDIAVTNVVATWFGGPDDPSDSGETASGISTRDNPNLLGCALPMDGFNIKATDGSPIPRLPWQTAVRVKNLQTNTELTFPLIDLGPSKFAASNAAIDLTKAAFSALGSDPAKGVIRVSYVIPGGAQKIPSPSVKSASITQSETNSTPQASLPPKDTAHGQIHDIPKPPVQFVESPNYSSRNNTKIDMVVMHFTDGSSAQGAINRFLNPAEQVSAHYIVDRDGTIYQMVRDTDKAWHAKAANARSIGIEHVALPGQQMTPAQTTSSVSLIKWLTATYAIPKSGITGHRFAPGNEGTTDCPDHLFGDATEQAVINWVNVKFPAEVS